MAKKRKKIKKTETPFEFRDFGRDKLRDFGRQENMYVLANIFNPDSLDYGDLDLVEETAQEACHQAGNAFGHEDPIYIEALINLALFYWRRRSDALKAENTLERVTKILSQSYSNEEELLTELIAVSVLVQLLKDRIDEQFPVIDRIVNLIPHPFGIGSNQMLHAQAIEIYRRMVQVALNSDHAVLPYLVSEVGQPLALDLAAAEFRTDAVEVLTNILSPLHLKVWEPTTYQVRLAKLEADWLTGSSMTNASRWHDLERLADDLQAVIRSPVTRCAVLDKDIAPEYLAARRALLKAFEYANQIIQSPILQRASQIDVAIGSFEAVLHEFDLTKCVEGLSSGTVNPTTWEGRELLVPALTSLACLQMSRSAFGKVEYLELALNYLQQAFKLLDYPFDYQNSFFLRFLDDCDDHSLDDFDKDDDHSLDDFDEDDEVSNLFPSSYEGISPAELRKIRELEEASIYSFSPSQSELSRAKLKFERLKWCQSLVDSINNNLTDDEAIEDSLQLLFTGFIGDLTNVEAIGRSLVLLADADRICVLLADVYSRRVHGNLEENANAILVYTDSLDLEKETDSYYWALGKFLRGVGFLMRQETKLYLGANPNRDMSRFDMDASVGFFEEALEVFTKDDFPYEWASVILHWCTAVKPMIAAELDLDLNLQLAGLLSSAEEVFTPITYASNWATIQLYRLQLAQNMRGNDVEGFHKNPLEWLFRAQIFLTKNDHPQLWGQFELEKARILAASNEKALRWHALKHYNNSLMVFSEPDSKERFTVLSELGNLLFFDKRFVDAISPLKEAISIGERRFYQSHSMHERRISIWSMEGLSKILSYCYYEMNQLNDAVITLDRGKSRLLQDILYLRHRDMTDLNTEDRLQAEQLLDEVRRLESSSYGGMGYIEGMERLIEARQELKKLFSDSRDSLVNNNSSVCTLSNLPSDAALVIPLISEHGSVVFIVTSGLETLTSQHIVSLPLLSSNVVQSWLFDSEVCGWFPAYEKRNGDDVSGEHFEATISKICSLLWEASLKDVCERLKELEISEIIFIPSAGLQFLPILASGMPSSDSKTSGRLIDEFRFRTVPSAGVLSLLEAGSKQLEAKGRAVVAGVAEYEELVPLPNVEKEVRAIADEFGVEPLLNDEVTVSVLAEQLSKASFIHLACHGASWAEYPMYVSYDPPPVLYLTNNGVSFRDILVKWDLRQASLITLSACDTGLVDFDRPWDEFEGLSHVLLQAGARAVVSSLWSIDDESTTLLMVRFYENLLTSKCNLSEALGEAQRWLRESTHASLATDYPDLYQLDGLDTSISLDECPFAHPYYWASFFITG